MKNKKIGSAVLFLTTLALLGACGNQGTTDNSIPSNNSVPVNESSQVQGISNTQLSFNDATYTVVMNDTPTGRELVSFLPSTQMRLPASYDQDNLYKYYDLARTVVTNPETITSVKAGDVLLDGDDRLMLYYKDADITGQYTRIGHVENPENLATDLGDDSVIFVVSRLSN